MSPQAPWAAQGPTAALEVALTVQAPPPRPRRRPQAPGTAPAHRDDWVFVCRQHSGGNEVSSPPAEGPRGKDVRTGAEGEATRTGAVPMISDRNAQAG